MDDKDKMLIDAAHPEETRVVVLRGNRVEEFDFESATKQPLRGNIYLAKITRVEPSLQAAFVDYGGNRHGFLAFNEIHPDYYQIPVADRQLLLDEEAKQARAELDDDDSDEVGDAGEPDGDAQSDDEDATPEQDETSDAVVSDVVGAIPTGDSELLSGSEANADTTANADDETPGEGQSEALLAAGDAVVRSAPIRHDEIDDEDNESALDIDENPSDVAPDVVGDTEQPEAGDQVEAAAPGDSDNPESDENGAEEQNEPDDDDGGEVKARGRRRPARRSRTQDDDEVESVGSEDALEELPQRRQRHRSYKIQEVIKRHQIVLVQVVKEERGNKGAALTTYMSLAGRYTVLMPNTARGGGISRKITNATDRKRLRKIADELEVPQGMGLIIRTAGASRTKAEIKRDFEYLLRLWENVRELTLKSTAPALVYEEGDLIKRSIRDLYSKEIGEVLVAGEQGHKNAKDFMRMLTPSHAKNVKLYDESEPLFSRFQIERQLNAMYSPFVTLRSGGYIVINQTEALVAVDVNSGKSTREHSIEDTALGTNLEASEEISRQLRLRDLAGLVVIDFIDMEERRNNRAVERRLKDCLKNDRARIQVGRISHFGLLEMSRQRLRTGMLEGSTSQCQHCQGTGVIRSTESVALSVLRAVEEALMSGEKSDLTAVTSVEAALYILNNKREYVQDIEERYEVAIRIVGDDTLHGANFTVERANDQSDKRQSKKSTVVQMDWSFQSPGAGGRDEDGSGKKRRRRRSRRRDGDDAQDTAQPVEASEETNVDGEQPTVQTEDGDERRPRRRGKRGGRRNRRPASSDSVAEVAAEGAENGANAEAPSGSDQPVQDDGETRAAAPEEARSATRPRRRQRRPRGGARRNGNGARESGQATEGTGSHASSNDDAQPVTSRDDAGSEPVITPPSTIPATSTAQPETVTAKPQPQPQDVVETSAPTPQRSSKRGWWQRRIGSG